MPLDVSVSNCSPLSIFMRFSDSQHTRSTLGAFLSAGTLLYRCQFWLSSLNQLAAAQWGGLLAVHRCAGGDFLFNSWALVQSQSRLHCDNLPWVFPHGQRSRRVAPVFFLPSKKEEKVIVQRPLSPCLGSKCVCAARVCLCVWELWIILLPGWMHESAFSVSMLSVGWRRCTDWERSAVTSWPHHRHTLCSEAKETGLLSIPPPSREHLDLSWLS